MAKKYARVSDYGDILIPLSLLEKVIEQCLIVNTTYQDGVDTINKVKKIDRVQFHDQEELDAARAQMILEGDNV